MPEKHLYEYAIIRFVPCIEREEFINVGIILFSKRQKYIRVAYHIDEEKIAFFAPNTDIESLCCHLRIFERICSGEKEGGVIASFDIPERFRWLTAMRSTSIQTSRPHPGFSIDLDKTFEYLFRELVL
ncbi:DUF3037 domain-containing protein [Coprobacter secundus]|uniref:DUF3037 domain-containing protein n=1 Tax=Coprobacter secundus subsp. similis TaxID=2751153 RepID=A0A7G1HSX6_9BACT|nr:DUF3037 domain-containing protein [Coprobacter secundus]KHM46896.1 hypothetical protein PU94_09585 [Coprobacter secundus]BCI62855.1 hypothetical protein Cop2CBH44_12080 [Coprobacter secundus subsp. similis]